MKNQIELPAKYYLAHFREFLNSLCSLYSPFFSEPHHQFCTDFEGLSEDARCLYIRMVNRKGLYFFRDDLNYAEIASLEKVIAELMERGFVRTPCKTDLNPIFKFLPKNLLTDLLTQQEIAFKKSLSRPKLLELVEEKIQTLPDSLAQRVIVQDRAEVIQYLIFLYFGQIQDNLTLYILRDLGIRKTNTHQGKFQVRYQSRDEAMAHYYYAGLKRQLDDSSKTIQPMSEWPLASCTEAQQLRDEILLDLAESCKREQQLEKSLEYLLASAIHPAREKATRILYQLDRKNECQQLLNQMLETPLCDEECLFAEDFLMRKFEKKKLGVLTETLRNSRIISIDEGFFRHPEMGVVEFFKQEGHEAYHCENYLWQVLFGLFFWDEIFDQETATYHNAFDRIPSELKLGTFYKKNQDRIHRKLELLNNRANLLSIMQIIISTKNIEENPLFNWYEDSQLQLELFLKHADLSAVSFMLTYMAQDYQNRCTGFPDLMVIKDQMVVFYEIKAEGDSLKQKQLLQILTLKQAGFQVEILQVKYTMNPDQLYVVVDLETTGLGPGHRITEIGAVKLRGEEIIGTYQTLVNPERSIPRMIQDLTGITNEMVRGAPLFAEVADAFHEFSQGCIFVAHNVNFDYKFLQAEFEKLERPYVRPFICTKAGMKKHYPGETSYGLGNLTRQFSITLKNHHRALCDAEAAAQLLLLINQKRRELSLTPTA